MKSRSFGWQVNSTFSKSRGLTTSVDFQRTEGLHSSYSDYYGRQSFHDITLYLRLGGRLLRCTRSFEGSGTTPRAIRSWRIPEIGTGAEVLAHPQDYAVITPNGIDEAEYVKIGGLEQWITIRGEDRKNPVLLFLHGGPGDATNPWGYAGFRSWLKYFTVVQWDQRGAGRTFGRNGAAAGSTITIERMVQDGVELTELLSRRLQKDKIVLVGHSWGSILGVVMAKARPELFYAFVGTGQVADPMRNYVVAHAALVERASRDGNSRALQELNEIGPPPYKDGKGFAVQRKWSNLFEGADAFLASTLGLALTAPRYSLADIDDWFEGQNVSAERLVPQTSALDPKVLRGKFAVPVFVIQGAQDFTTPTSLAKGYLSSLHTPRKAFATIGGTGHFAVFTRQDVFLKELRTLVLPLIRTSR